MKTYFSTLGNLVEETNNVTGTTKSITKFNELMITAYREFYFITPETIIDLRKSHHLKVVHDLDTYAKRGVIRNLTLLSKFNKDQLLRMCDHFFSVQLYENGGAIPITKSDRLDYKRFKLFLSKFVVWANTSNDSDLVSGNRFMKYVFNSVFLGESTEGSIDFQGSFTKKNIYSKRLLLD